MDDSLNAGQAVEPASEMHLPDILIPDHNDFFYYYFYCSFFPQASKAAITTGTEKNGMNRRRPRIRSSTLSEGLPRACHIVLPQIGNAEVSIDHADAVK